MDYGIVVDLETTGLKPKEDKIIEIGILEFGVDENHNSFISRSYGAVEDPGIPITPEITKITGIENKHVAGQKIDWEVVRSFFEKASVVVAHNANFDKGFLQEREEVASILGHWACSVAHIDWRKHGHSTRALNYLAADHGFVNPFAHRAIFDCATTYRLIAPHLKELIDKSYLKQFNVKAVGSPFESKDVLKKRGYRWSPEEKVWSKSVLEDGLESERKFLEEEVYRGPSKHHETELT